jgi:hypothetical protein
MDNFELRCALGVTWRSARQLGEAEVCQPELGARQILFGHEQVGWLQVAVNDTAFV